MARFCARLYGGARALAWSVAITACLSACSSTQLRSFFGPPDDEVGRDESDVAAAPPAPRVSAPQGKPAPRKPAAVRLAKPVVPAPVTSVAGLGQEEVRRILGEPQELVEIDGRRTWIYRGAGCRVEVTFFRDVTRGSYSALAHRVVRSDTGEDSAAPCVRGLRSAAR